MRAHSLSIGQTSRTVREVWPLSIVTHKTRATDEILVESDAMYLKPFKQQTLPDAITLPLPYLPDRTFWPVNKSNQSPTEATKSNEMFIIAHKNNHAIASNDDK